MTTEYAQRNDIEANSNSTEAISAAPDRPSEVISAASDGPSKMISSALHRPSEVISAAPEGLTERLSAAQNRPPEVISAAPEGPSKVISVAPEGSTEMISAAPEEPSEAISATSNSSSDVSSAAPYPPIHPGFILKMCGRFSFPYLLILSVTQLAIYINKLYQDSAAVGTYFSERELNYFMVSAATLVVPILAYMIYTVAPYVIDEEDPKRKEVGTKMIHGLLLWPWQIKERVEVIDFSSKKVWENRPLTPDELEQKCLLEKQAAVVEFFGKFYAGLMQLLLQLYIVIKALDEKQPYSALTPEIVASGLALISMMLAVYRKDNGLLTGCLSFFGWVFIMISRSVAIALATRVIYGWMLLICVVHGLLISFWVTSIAIKTYQETSFNKRRTLSLYFLVFTVFGLPSLTYWPIMFEPKKKKRPLIFLIILLLENLLFSLLWASLREDDAWCEHDSVLLVVALGGYALGSLFVSSYIYCKPKYTDDIVYHDMKASHTNSFGMYFEFCDKVFKITKNEVVEANLKKIRKQMATEG